MISFVHFCVCCFANPSLVQLTKLFYYQCISIHVLQEWFFNQSSSFVATGQFFLKRVFLALSDSTFAVIGIVIWLKTMTCFKSTVYIMLSSFCGKQAYFHQKYFLPYQYLTLLLDRYQEYTISYHPHFYMKQQQDYSSLYQHYNGSKTKPNSKYNVCQQNHCMRNNWNKSLTCQHCSELWYKRKSVKGMRKIKAKIKFSITMKLSYSIT